MKPEHLKIQTLNPYDTKGGQHAGVVPSGVCVTHIPTGLTATCFIERSQTRNRNVALAMIEYGLAELGFDDQRNMDRPMTSEEQAWIDKAWQEFKDTHPVRCE